MSAVKNIEGWWDIGLPPSIDEWCAKNVEDACEALSNGLVLSIQLSESGTMIVQPFSPNLWECEVGKPTSLSSLFDDFLKLNDGDNDSISVVCDELQNIITRLRQSNASGE